jgi:hypothetical protein
MCANYGYHDAPKLFVNTGYLKCRPILQNFKKNKMDGARSTDGERKRAFRVLVMKSEGKRSKT